jgi:hypothetical protein
VAVAEIEGFLFYGVGPGHLEVIMARQGLAGSRFEGKNDPIASLRQ